MHDCYTVFTSKGTNTKHKEDVKMMYNMSRMIAEDIGAPEMRDPRNSSMRPVKSLFQKLFGKKK